MTTQQTERRMSIVEYLRHQGHEKGLEQGLEQGKLSLAHALIKAGVDPDQITRISGFSRQQIEEMHSEETG